jgi:2-methylisocitrate lyase-like PEP mutase family enzyme
MSGLLGESPAPRKALPALLEAGEMVLAPGCYDALGARLVEEAGFTAAYMTGFGTAASLLGRPDVGLLGMTEMVDGWRRGDPYRGPAST